MDLSFYRGKKILVTGHTGFKGAWLCKILKMLGADVLGYAKEPNTSPSLFEILGLGGDVLSVIGDIRNPARLLQLMTEYKPDAVFHLAAQAIVREGYENPRETYEVNVLGTVNVLEAVRKTKSARSVINVTTDKVYLNKEWDWGYREIDALDGYDPYSNSKSCSELVTASYKRAFFDKAGVAVSCCRAGNVIGGGDFSRDRIIPDCVRAAMGGEEIVIRNPYSTRPYQHVLEPLCAYLELAALQYDNPLLDGCYNIGPDEADCVRTGELVDIFSRLFGGLKWRCESDINAPHEANFLKLDSSKIKRAIGWRPRLNIERAVGLTVEWSKAYIEGGDVLSITERQIKEYLKAR